MNYITKKHITRYTFCQARAVGIEPTLEVLETPVLPLYDAR